MNPTRRGALAFLAALVLAGGAAGAQSGEKFTARLAWVPTSGADRGNVAGRGTATATLSGSTLTIAGTFEGLPASATVARLHQGVAIGARGDAIADLTISKGDSGKISGTVTLTPQQLERLKQGWLYVQLHSEKGVEPDGGTLWGWLLR